jgi:hypothetical protein
MNLQALPEEALKEILALTEAKKKLDLREKAQDYFMPELLLKSWKGWPEES